MMSVPIAPPRRPLTDLLVNPLRLLFSARPWSVALFGVLSFAIGLFWFVTLVTLISSGVGLAITFFGLPILLFAVWLWVQGARLERWRVNAFFGTSIRSSYRALPEGSWLVRLRAFVTDPAVWRDLAYMLLLFPVGIAELFVVAVAITLPLRLITAPLWYASVPDGVGTRKWAGSVGRRCSPLPCSACRCCC